VIAKLSGRIEALGDGEAVIDVGGVGFLVHVSARTLNALKQGEHAVLFIETQVRAEAIQLFGFAGAAERAWFKALQTVQGVGPRAALAVLSVLSADELAAAIVAEDRAAIGRANGIGAKLAARIIAELREKAHQVSPPLARAPAAASGAARAAAADAVSALVNLGFKPLDALQAVNEAAARLGPAAGLDALIRSGLQALAPREAAP
jgi:Holliday junction DNA helicase RuvA